MSSIPIYQKGQTLSSVILTGQTIDALGAITDSVTVTTATAIMDGLDAQISRILEEISPINAAQDNNVKIINSYSFAVTLLRVDAIGGAQVDANTFFTDVHNGNFDYWKMVYITGVAGGSQATVTLYGIVNTVGDSIQGKGRQNVPVTFNSVDISGAASSITRVVA